MAEEIQGHHEAQQPPLLMIADDFLEYGEWIYRITIMGREPIRVNPAKFGGTVVMQDQQDNGLPLALTLSESQRPKAILPLRKLVINQG